MVENPTQCWHFPTLQQFATPYSRAPAVRNLRQRQFVCPAQSLLIGRQMRLALIQVLQAQDHLLCTVSTSPVAANTRAASERRPLCELPSLTPAWW